MLLPPAMPRAHFSRCRCRAILRVYSVRYDTFRAESIRCPLLMPTRLMRAMPAPIHAVAFAADALTFRAMLASLMPRRVFRAFALRVARR